MGTTYEMSRQYTYQELSKAGDPFIKMIDDFIGTAVQAARKYRGNLLQPSEAAEAKKDSGADFRNIGNIVRRDSEQDRKHQLDRVIINDFNSRNGTDLENVKIIYGPSADEYARSNHALALTIANRIYFRNGAYRPETEEGRELLAHELTHVAQYQEKRITTNTTKDELENEAERNEQQEVYNPDPVITINMNGHLFSFSRSQMDSIAEQAASDVISDMESQADTVHEKEYLFMLSRMKKLIESGDTRWLQ